MVLVYHKAGLLQPIPPQLILPEVVDQTKWWSKKHLYSDPEGQHVFMAQGDAGSGIGAINTNLIKPGEIDSWWDLLEPKYRGKILMTDPDSAGNIGNWRFIYYSPDLGVKFRLLFPAVLLLDAVWASTPLLFLGQLRGLVVLCAAGLGFLPFCQRTLLYSAYANSGGRSSAIQTKA